MDEQVIPVAIFPPTNRYESYLSSASIYLLALITNLNATNKRSISYDNLDRSNCRYCWYCCFYNGSETGICRVHASTSAAGEMLSSRKPRKSPASSGLLSPGGGVPTSETKLTLEAVQSVAVKGKLVCEKGIRYDNNPGIAGATITFTGSMPHSLTAETDSNGDYLAGLGTPEKPGTYNVQAHFSGATLRGSPGRVSFTGSDSDIVTIHVK
jgi:hypothetical protein